MTAAATSRPNNLSRLERLPFELLTLTFSFASPFWALRNLTVVFKGCKEAVIDGIFNQIQAQKGNVVAFTANLFQFCFVGQTLSVKGNELKRFFQYTSVYLSYVERRFRDPFINDLINRSQYTNGTPASPFTPIAAYNPPTLPYKQSPLPFPTPVEWLFCRKKMDAISRKETAQEDANQLYRFAKNSLSVVDPKLGEQLTALLADVGHMEATPELEKLYRLQIRGLVCSWLKAQTKKLSIPKENLHGDCFPREMLQLLDDQTYLDAFAKNASNSNAHLPLYFIEEMATRSLLEKTEPTDAEASLYKAAPTDNPASSGDPRVLAILLKDARLPPSTIGKALDTITGGEISFVTVHTPEETTLALLMSVYTLLQDGRLALEDAQEAFQKTFKKQAKLKNYRESHYHLAQNSISALLQEYILKHPSSSTQSNAPKRKDGKASSQGATKKRRANESSTQAASANDSKDSKDSKS
jgi:hypothetical protein